MDTKKSLIAAEVREILTGAGVDQSQLTITDDPAVWTDIFTGESDTSVRIDGPKVARRAASNVLMERGFSEAPYPDHAFYSR